MSRFGDDTWDLSPLSRRQHEPGRGSTGHLPGDAARQLQARRMGTDQPAHARGAAGTRGHRRAQHPSAGTIATIAEQWRRYATGSPAGASPAWPTSTPPATASGPRTSPATPAANRTRGQALDAVSMLWGIAPHLPPGDRIPMPPWEAEGMRDYLPPDEGRNENGTAPVHPAVMSPLLTWALRFTEDFAADILAALAEQERLRSRIAASHNPEAAARLAALLDEHARTGTPLPGETVKGRRSAACSYLAGKTGASITQAPNAIRRAGLPVAETAPLDIPITGRCTESRGSARSATTRRRPSRCAWPRPA